MSLRQTVRTKGAVLGVTRSCTGMYWNDRLDDDQAVSDLAQRLGLPEVLARLLAARGIEADGVDGFLEPRVKHLMPDPLDMVDMTGAVRRIADAVEADETIGIFGDYDVDGATSAALLVRYLDCIGAKTVVHIPDRRKEGYGPSINALASLKERGAGPVVTVDCGITAHEPLRLAHQAGIDIIVLDHHQVAGDLPQATALVNPNRSDCGSGLGHLAAVGVTFMTVVAINRELRQRGRFDQCPEPDLMQWLDLVALGTLCDSVPLTGLNRALVRQGLKVLGRGGNEGLMALGRCARLTEDPTAHHAVFVFGPRINAGGRVGDPALGVRLLTSRDEEEVAGIAVRLDDCNRERRRIEKGVLAAAMNQAGAQASRHCCVVSGKDWHPGVLGIVASRLVDRFSRPAVVISTADTPGTGSCRSVRGVNIGAAVGRAVEEGILVRGGGHPAAAGLAVEEDRISDLASFLDHQLAREIAALPDVPELGIDGVLSVAAVNEDLIRSIERAGPFGTGNARPRFAIKDARVSWAQRVGDHHVRVTARDAGGARLDAIAFRVADDPLGKALLTSDTGSFHLAGHLAINTWRGKQSPQLIIEDAAVAT